MAARISPASLRQLSLGDDSHHRTNGHAAVEDRHVERQLKDLLDHDDQPLAQTARLDAAEVSRVVVGCARAAVLQLASS